MEKDSVKNKPMHRDYDTCLSMAKEATWIELDYYKLILVNDFFSTDDVVLKQVRMIYYNLHKILIVNPPKNNDQGFSVLMRMMVCINYTPINVIQVL